MCKQSDRVRNNSRTAKKRLRSACPGYTIRTMVQISNSGSNKVGSERMRRKSETRRLGILRAAARVFRRSGVAAAGMREIADEADLSPGNLYYYFAGKDELLFFCQDRTLDRMLEAAEAARASIVPVSDQLRAVIRAHLHYTLDELEGATAHLEIDMLAEDLRRSIIEKRDKYEHAVRALVVKGVRRGDFVSCDAALVARAILGALNWTVRWYRPDGAQSVAAIAEALADYLVRGIAALPRNGTNKEAPAAGRDRSPASRPHVPKGDFSLKGDQDLGSANSPRRSKPLSTRGHDQRRANTMTMTAPARAVPGGRK
jgi:AcrR family transcriptional regulator